MLRGEATETTDTVTAGHAAPPTRRRASPRTRSSGWVLRARRSGRDGVPRQGSTASGSTAPYKHYRQAAGSLRQLRPAEPREGHGHRVHRRPRHRGDLGHHCLQLVNDPTYVSWHYTLRSVDGHVAQHVDNRNVGCARRQLVHQHALHRLGARGLRGGAGRLVHRVALPRTPPLSCSTSPPSTASRSTAPTSSATTRCRASCPPTSRHAVGPGAVLGLGALLRPARRADRRRRRWHEPGRDRRARLRGQPAAGDPVRRRRHDRGCLPGAGHELRVPLQPARPGLAAGHRRRSEADGGAVDDRGLRHRRPGARRARSSCVAGGARATGPRSGGLGADAWVHNPVAAPTLLPSRGQVVTPSATTSVHGVRAAPTPRRRRTPARDARTRAVLPLQYSDQARPELRAGRRGHRERLLLREDFPCKYVALDCTEVSGADRYYQIWFGHRIAYVRARGRRDGPGPLARGDERHGHRAQQQTELPGRGGRARGAGSRPGSR